MEDVAKRMKDEYQQRLADRRALGEGDGETENASDKYAETEAELNELVTEKLREFLEDQGHGGGEEEKASLHEKLNSSIEPLERALVIEFREHDRDVQHIAMLFRAYDPHAWYFEVVECIRRLLLTGFLGIIGETTHQIIVASLISFTFLIIYGYLEPYSFDTADYLQATAQLVTFLQLYFGLLITTDALPSSDFVHAAVTLLMILLHGLVLTTGVESSFGEEYKLVTQLHALAEACSEEDAHLAELRDHVADTTAHSGCCGARCVSVGKLHLAKALRKQQTEEQKREELLEAFQQAGHRDPFKDKAATEAGVGSPLPGAEYGELGISPGPEAPPVRIVRTSQTGYGDLGHSPPPDAPRPLDGDKGRNARAPLDRDDWSAPPHAREPAPEDGGGGATSRSERSPSDFEFEDVGMGGGRTLAQVQAGLDAKRS